MKGELSTRSPARPANTYWTSEIEDCTLSWTYPAESFDYVHLRLLVGSISDWEALLTEAYRALKPGGWVESFEGAAYFESDDGTLTEAHALGQWGKLFANFGETIGRPFTLVADDIQKRSMQAAGFVDIHEAEYKVCVFLVDSYGQSPKALPFLMLTSPRFLLLPYASCDLQIKTRYQWGLGPRIQGLRRLAVTRNSLLRPISRATSCIPQLLWDGSARRSPCTPRTCVRKCGLRAFTGTTARRPYTGGSRSSCVRGEEAALVWF